MGIAETRLERLSEHAAKHTLKLKVDEFFEGNSQHRGALAHDIMLETKAAHSFVVAFGEKNKRDVSTLWRDIRWNAREYQDAQYRNTLPDSKKHLFDTLKAYKNASLEVGAAWKSAFKKQEAGKPLSPEVLKPIEALAEIKNQLAFELSSQPNADNVFAYFKLDKETLAKPAHAHVMKEQVGQFLKPAIHFKSLIKTATVIAEDLKNYYPIIKQMGVDTSRLNRFMSVAARQSLLETLSVI